MEQVVNGVLGQLDPKLLSGDAADVAGTEFVGAMPGNRLGLDAGTESVVLGSGKLGFRPRPGCSVKASA
jgi:hypothetical protein